MPLPLPTTPTFPKRIENEKKRKKNFIYLFIKKSTPTGMSLPSTDSGEANMLLCFAPGMSFDFFCAKFCQLDCLALNSLSTALDLSMRSTFFSDLAFFFSICFCFSAAQRSVSQPQ